MTPEQYAAAMDKSLKGLSPALQVVVRNWSYEYGHSAGYHEVWQIADQLAGDLLAALKGEVR